MTTILVASDATWVRDQVRAAFVAPGQRVIEVTRGQQVRDAFAAEEPDLVILDLQIGNMGGIATAIDLRLEESADRLSRATVLLLLDREADRFLAKRADADGALVKPVDAGTLRRTAKRMLAEADERVRRAEEAYAALDDDSDGSDGDVPAVDLDGPDGPAAEAG